MNPELLRELRVLLVACSIPSLPEVSLQAGKLVWRGAECWEAALHLLAVAQQHSGHRGEEFIQWRSGILRPALVNDHAKDFIKNSAAHGSLRCVNASEAMELCPSLSLPPDTLVLHITEGVNVHPKRYLQALWGACESFATTAGNSSSATLHKQRVSCLKDLCGDYEAVIVCLGAQAALLPELSSKLPLVMCRGVAVDMESASAVSSTTASPCILSKVWVAFQEQGRLVLGATKEWDADPASGTALISSEAGDAALQELLSRADDILPSLRLRWKAAGIRAGVRAVPPRTSFGRLPLAGCLDELVELGKQEEPCYLWMLGGLGSRGLIYHAWLGAKVAEAVVCRNEDRIPAEFRSFAAARLRA